MPNTRNCQLSKISFMLRVRHCSENKIKTMFSVLFSLKKSVEISLQLIVVSDIYETHKIFSCLCFHEKVAEIKFFSFSK